MNIFQSIWGALTKPFRTLHSILAYQLQPPPLNEFTDYDNYWEKRGKVPVIYRRWEVAAETFELNSTVLDVGCGNGEFLSYLREKRPDLILKGCDTSAIGVERAKSNGLDVFVHDLASGPPPGIYDYLTCLDVLEHIAYSERAFRNLKSSFRKKIVISLPNIGCLRCRIRLAIFGKFPLTVCNFHVNEHLRHWTLKDFRYWMKQEDMIIERMEGQYGLRGFYRWFPSLFAHGLVYVMRRNESSRSGL